MKFFKHLLGLTTLFTIQYSALTTFALTEHDVTFENNDAGISYSIDAIRNDWGHCTSVNLYNEVTIKSGVGYNNFKRTLCKIPRGLPR